MSNTLTIYRGSWARGPGQPNMLFHPVRRDLCCLGFDALAHGCTIAQITDLQGPRRVLLGDDVPEAYRARYAPSKGMGQPVLDTMADNDTCRHHDDERETAVRADLIALGWEDVVFVDGTLPLLAEPPC